MGILPPAIRKVRKRKIGALNTDNKKVDYGLLKSMIRDEVDLQVNRKLKEVIQPLYQVVMSDSRYDTSEGILPDWAIELLRSEDINPSDTTDDADEFWGL